MDSSATGAAKFDITGSVATNGLVLDSGRALALAGWMVRKALTGREEMKSERTDKTRVIANTERTVEATEDLIAPP